MIIRKDRPAPIWQQKHEAFLKSVGTTSQIGQAAIQAYKNLRIALAGISVGLITWIFYLSNLFSTAKNNSENPLGAILIVAFVGLSIFLYRFLLHKAATLKVAGLVSLQAKCFEPPDYKSAMKKDEGITIDRVPLPDRNRFVLGYDGVNPVFATMNTKTFGSTCRWMLYGQDDRWGKEELPYTFIKGAFANDCLCVVLDCAGGCDFSPLRYKQFAQLYSDDFKQKYGRDKWDFVLQMSAMPYVVVRSSVEDRREINDALLWLDRELERRQNERAAIPGATWPFILVVLDTDLSEYYFNGKIGYENLNALERLAFGKALNTGVVALADSSRQWGEGNYQDCFDSIEFRHRIATKGKDENKQFTLRNVVEAAAFTAKLWERGEGREIKLVKTELPELGKWILEKGVSFNKKTYDLYLSCLNNELYVETEEPEPVELPKEHEISVGGVKIKQIRQGNSWFTPPSEKKKLKEAA